MSDSSSSATGRPELAEVDLVAAGWLPSLAAAFLEARDLDLLAPLGFLKPGEDPAPRSSAAAPDRRGLAAALAAANTDYGHPEAEPLARRLADPATKVVIAGQQPGLFGGPLYTLSKAVAAVLWAERLQAAGVPAVALFWMVTEDHDFREVSRAVFYAGAQPVRFDLGEDDEPLVPVGRRRLGARVSEVLDRMRGAVPGDRFTGWLEQLAAWYRPDATFGNAFAGLMVHLLGARSPLLVDSMLPALKQEQRPWLRRIVEQRQRLAEAFASRDREIHARGYPLQVTPQPDTLPLFVLHQGERRRVEWRGDGRLRLRGSSEDDEPLDWLLKMIDKEPARVSPGVQARSAIQDAVFGTHLQILGPGELSYLPQAAPLYELMEIPAPWVTLRPQVLVLEDHQADKLAATGLTLRELVDPGLDLDARLARPEQTAFLDVAAAALEAALEELKGPALELDPDLERPWTKTRDQMRRALQSFAGKVTAAAARGDLTTRQRVEALRGLCLPLGQPQERVVSTAHYPGKYGHRFIASLFEQMTLDAANLQVVCP